MQTNLQQEIVNLFEQYQLSEADIAKELQQTEDKVRGCLMQYSKIYRKLNKQLSKDEENEEKYKQYLENYAALVDYTDDVHLKEKVLKNLINEVKGRNDVGVNKLKQDKELALRGLNGAGNSVQNLTIFNVLLNKRRAAGEGNNKEILVKPTELLTQHQEEEELVCI